MPKPWHRLSLLSSVVKIEDGRNKRGLQQSPDLRDVVPDRAPVITTPCFQLTRAMFKNNVNRRPAVGSWELCHHHTSPCNCVCGALRAARDTCAGRCSSERAVEGERKGGLEGGG